ncbi:hypothetical protein GOP47_0025514 [Adiantum capillus-veneris]|uniref:Uncharacterized protein n=1 Tax=Adiantum capillus-veneris TaxID=13818 RepID=A0A9D4U0Q6_ADICA|nr:hypothetical protein GOP47_0025514 [Adiantum capillus-veneris]
MASSIDLSPPCDKHPLATKSITASTIYGIADAACQGIVRYRTAQHPEEIPWNVKKLMKAAAIGLFIAGPTAHFWYNFASKVIPARTFMGTFKKMALEQLILAPISAATVLAFSVFVQGKTVNQMASELEPLFPAILKNELLLWPASAFITYRHVPVHLQPLARNLTFLVWSMYLTYYAYSPVMIEAALGWKYDTTK